MGGMFPKESIREVARIIVTDSRLSMLQTTKITVAALASWLFCYYILRTTQTPIFAVIAAILVLQPSVNQSFRKALERFIGVIIGVLIATVFSVIGNGMWIVLAAMTASIIIAWAFRFSLAVATQLPISTLLVLSLGHGEAVYSFERIIETFIGAAIAFSINAFIVPPVSLTALRANVHELAERIALVLEQLADAGIGAEGALPAETILDNARQLRVIRQRGVSSMQNARESLTKNVRARKLRAEMELLDAALGEMTDISSGVIGMARAFRDRYSEDLVHEKFMRKIAREMCDIAHDLRLKHGLAHGGYADDEAAHLTGPLNLKAPSGDHWVLIGSLVEDLRRMNQLVQGETEAAPMTSVINLQELNELTKKK